MQSRKGSPQVPRPKVLVSGHGMHQEEHSRLTRRLRYGDRHSGPHTMCQVLNGHPLIYSSPNLGCTNSFQETICAWDGAWTSPLSSCVIFRKVVQPSEPGRNKGANIHKTPCT